MSCRKKIDSKMWLDYTQTMESEVRTLKQELSRTREALKLATKRCRDLVRELDSRTVCHESERCLRDQQLSRILRALLVLESRLKQEQKSIRQLLCEKDTVIRNQQLEIAKLRRYTKNYIKTKREQNRNGNPSKDENDKDEREFSSLSSSSNVDEAAKYPPKVDSDSRVAEDEDRIDDEIRTELGNDIRRLKREIIDKLREKDTGGENPANRERNLQDRNCAIRKTGSFAGSDVSKESCASSENTDAGSIVTTTDESSPSLLSTEGFCEGESTDCSPGSTLNKPSSKSFTKNEQNSILEDEKMENNDRYDEDNPKRRYGVVRNRPLEVFFDDETKVTITRTESKDDGMDCNFASDEENLEELQEPIYVNSCTENNAKNLRDTKKKVFAKNYGNNNGLSKLDQDDSNVEETSGNWYSDPDEDRISCDDVFRHSTYRSNGNHNSVLECVNQILLRDMEEEENILTVPRRFKHRGRIVRFQPARLSDIESVGSEMERRNSEDCPGNDRDEPNDSSETGNFEATASEDEFGMRIEDSKPEPKSDLATDESAIPIVVIEPKNENPEEPRISTSGCLDIINPRVRVRSTSPILRMERIEEKTCLQMSSKGLTIAKNLDYEDIESLPEIISPVPKTPPALPPKPTQFRSTLVLKKIPSPSFLIDETRRKNEQRKLEIESREITSCLSTPNKPTNQSVKSLNFDDKYSTSKINENDPHDRNKLIGKLFHTDSRMENLTPRVTSMVRHFEEFKIGSENERSLLRDLGKRKGQRTMDFDDFDIRQNFEEFNLDDCDLSDDPDRPEADGSDRLANMIPRQSSDDSNVDNNNVIYTSVTNGIYDNFLEATGLSNKSILTPSRLLSNHKSMLKPKDVKYKNKIKSNAMEKNGSQTGSGHLTQVRHWTGPFV